MDIISFTLALPFDPNTDKDLFDNYSPLNLLFAAGEQQLADDKIPGTAIQELCDEILKHGYQGKWKVTFEKIH